MVTLLMKMMNQMKNLKHNSFSVRETDLRGSFQTQKDFGIAKYSTLLYSIKKTNPSNFYARNELEKRKNGFEKIIMRKLRVFKVKTVFDSITFSRDFLDSIEDVLNMFDVVSNNQIFGILDEKYYQTGPVEFKLPHWFKTTSLNTFATWIVAHFEKRIYLCFKEGESVYENKMPITLREDYLEVWNSLAEDKQEEIICKVVDHLDQFREEAFGSRELIPNYKENNRGLGRSKHFLQGDPVIRLMNWNEIVFKLNWVLNSSMKSLEGMLLEDFKKHIKRKIIIESKGGNSAFIFSCVSPNLVESMKIEKFFMNLMVQYLHDLYIQKNIDELTKEEQQKGKKGKKRNRRNKKKKKRRKNDKKKAGTGGNGQKDALKKEDTNVIVEIVETPTLGSGNRDEFMLKLRKKIKEEGDKKGLLTPLLADQRDTHQNLENKKEENEIEKAEVVIEKVELRKQRAKFFCEKIHKLIEQKNQKKQKDTKSLCNKEKSKLKEDSNIEENSDYLYQSVKTTGMEAFWEDSKNLSIEGDSFFFWKDKKSEKEHKSSKEQKSEHRRPSKGGFSFGCRSQSGKEKEGECRSEGSKVVSGKIRSIGNTFLELKDIKIDEEIEKEKEMVSPKFEIKVPLKMVKGKEMKENDEMNKKKGKKEEEEGKRGGEGKKGKRRKRGKKYNNEKREEKGNKGNKEELVNNNIGENKKEGVSQMGKKNRKSRSLCEMMEKKEKEGGKIEKKKNQKRNKGVKMKYKLKKSKKDRKRRHEKKDQKMAEMRIGPRKEDKGQEMSKKTVQLKRPKKQEVKDQKKQAVKDKKVSRGKVQKWEESEEEKKEIKQEKKKKANNEANRKKVDKKPKLAKPGKWTQKEEKPLKFEKPKKSLRAGSSAFVFKPKKKPKSTMKINKTSAFNPQLHTFQNMPNFNNPYMPPNMMMNQQMSTAGFSYENLEFNMFNEKLHFQSQSGVNAQGVFQNKSIDNLTGSPQIHTKKQILERKSEDVRDVQALIKSQEFFSRRDFKNKSNNSHKGGFSSKVIKTNFDSKETQDMKLTRLVDQEKQHITKLTKEAFSAFVGENIKKVVADLKSQAESLSTHRKIILNRINCIVHKSFKTTEVNVCPYGSYATNLLTPFSDLDLALTFNMCNSISHEETKQFLNTLENNLRLFTFVKESKKVLTASVPVIKIVADASIEFKDVPEKASDSRLIKVDIIVGSFDENGDVNPAFRTTDYIKNCINYYSSFYELALFFKFALASNNLSNAFSGGLNAYGLCILLAAFLDHFNYESCTDVGFLAIEFLQFLTKNFNPQIIGVSIGGINRRSPFVPLKSLGICAHLVILDPTARIPKNVTPSCFRIFQVLTCFRDGLLRMQNTCNFMEHKLLKKLEEIINQTISEENRLKILTNMNLYHSHLSTSLPNQRLSLNNRTNQSLLLSNFEPNLFQISQPKHCPSEVLSQDIRQKNSSIPTPTEFKNNNTIGPKSLKTKSEIKFSHSNTTSPQSKTEETGIPSEILSSTLKQQQRKVKEITIQLQNLSNFQIYKEDLLRLFQETYPDMMEASFKLNGHSPEDISGCESVVHEKLQNDMNFEAKRKENNL